LTKRVERRFQRGGYPGYGICPPGWRKPKIAAFLFVIAFPNEPLEKIMAILLIW